MTLVSAVLGPTNTGKTHHAMSRMLTHPTGVMGFPLRLLARENYDRLVARLGPDRVALVTGEERIVPARPDYWLSTTEAMPDRPVAFVGVDEIQLCGHKKRGHVFTARMLQARGTRETMFCGADTVQDVLSDIVPHAQVEHRPRRSALRHLGHASLSSLPARSCVIAFSAQEVYRLAEKVRQKRGGAAVVLGALSPRARNAQVELFQSGRVDVLVATDAVGMGLNLDIQHVAFARTRKFDGERIRGLSAAELAQVAGRAGRNQRDGTFGTCDEAAPLSDEVVRAIEEHAFDPVPFVWYRNTDLDYTSIETLVDSLRRPPPMARARRAAGGVDQLTFERLAQDPKVAGPGLREADVRRLWAVCQVPDYRRNLDDGHARFCRQLYIHLRDRGAVPDAVIERALSRLGDVDVDTDALTVRLSDVRTWAYVAHRADWTAHPARYQAMAAEVEERVSDALHDRLTARFVDELKRVAVRRTDDELSGLLEVDENGTARIEGQVVARIDGLTVTSDGGADRDRLRLARRALSSRMHARVDALLDADVDRFTLDQDTLCFDGARVGRLTRGKRRYGPEVAVTLDDLLAERTEDVRHKLQAVTNLRLEEVFGALPAAERERSGGRVNALLYLLAERFGVSGRRDLSPALQALTPDDKRALRGLGVRIGQRTVSLRYRAGVVPFAWRWAVAKLWHQQPVGPVPVAPTQTSVGRDAVRGDEGWVLGFAPIGGKRYRIDALEKVAGLAQKAARTGPFVLDESWCSRLAASQAEVGEVLGALGFAATDDGRFSRRPARRGRRRR